MRARLLSLLAVLACAAVGFIARSALERDPPMARVLPAAPAAATSAFASSAAVSRSVPSDGYLIATARRRSIPVFRRPAASRSTRRIRQRVMFGRRIPLVFLARDRRPGWVKVWLPTRPNRSSAWVRRRDVDFSITRTHLRIRRKAHRLDVFEGRRRIASHPIAIGKALSPTPRGRYYVTDLIRSTDPDGFYGPYALGMSAHSPVYTSYGDGDGQIGIHGTDAPEKLGTDVSAGCIRVSNAVVRRLARTVPLGAPVDVKP